jgi:hypothetical protein
MYLRPVFFFGGVFFRWLFDELVFATLRLWGFVGGRF